MSTYVERLLDKLIKLQDEVKEKDLRLKQYLIEGDGRAGLIEVLGPEGGVFGFICRGGRIERYEGSEYLTKITMSEDTFLDIVSGVADLDEAYARGHIRFSGKDWLVHAQRFRDGFKTMRYLFRLLKVVK